MMSPDDADKCCARKTTPAQIGYILIFVVGPKMPCLDEVKVCNSNMEEPFEKIAPNFMANIKRASRHKFQLLSAADASLSCFSPFLAFREPSNIQWITQLGKV
jgi:hypothetical protein